jgi:amino-acid N-acetyltransferase
MEFRYRPARLPDVPAMAAIIAGFAERKLMLPRPNSELYENIRDFIVAEGEPGGLCGCVALHIDTERIAEVKALAVAPAAQGRGIGRGLVEAAIAEARAMGLERVFCLTYQADFFARLGFTRVDRARLPDKVWGECVRCHRFLDCDEVAMWRLVDPVAARPAPAPT